MCHTWILIEWDSNIATLSLKTLMKWDTFCPLRWNLAKCNNDCFSYILRVLFLSSRWLVLFFNWWGGTSSLRGHNPWPGERGQVEMGGYWQTWQLLLGTSWSCRQHSDMLEWMDRWAYKHDRCHILFEDFRESNQLSLQIYKKEINEMTKMMICVVSSV